MKISRLLIANRGEIAIRIARTCSRLGIETVSIFSQDDSESRHKLVTEINCPLDGTGSVAYLDIENIISIAKEKKCDAIHPGYGFLSENPEFASKIKESGQLFIGPSPGILSLFGDKSKAIGLAKRIGVPTIPGISGPATLDDIRKFFISAGENNSILIKATGGGGGRGMRIVRHIEDIEEAFSRCESEARSAFGNPDLFAELFTENARHVEVQIAADASGEIIHLWERDCSLQRRHQKLIEITPPPGLKAGLRKKIRDAAIKLAREAKYENIGTFEFLVQPDMESFLFLEANPRLQVEHTVTEEITGIDLVELQLSLSSGKTLNELGLTQENIPDPTGFAIQVRINAETLGKNGIPVPSAGIVNVFEPSSGLSVRVDSAGYSGMKINPHFDSLLAKLIIRSGHPEFSEAVSLIYRSLCEFRISGIETMIPFLLGLLQRPEVRNYSISTHFIDDHLSELAGISREKFPKYYFETKPVHNALDDMQNTHPVLLEIGGAISVRTPVTGILIEIVAGSGVLVRKGEKVAVVSAMKMEHQIIAQESGLIEHIPVKKGDSVIEEQSLIFLIPVSADEAGEIKIDQTDPDLIRPDLKESIERHEINLDTARKHAVSKRHSRNQRTARENINDLCDPGTFFEYGSLALAAQRRRRTLEELIRLSPADGLVAGLGSVNGGLFDSSLSRCALMSYDYTVFSGTQGAMNHKKTDRLLGVVENLQLPIIVFTEGGGGRPGEVDVPAVAGLDLTTFRKYAQLSGLAPRIAIASGRCFAGNASLFGSSDVTIATEDSSIGMGGPVMVRGGGIGNFSAEEIGPSSVLSKNGVIDILVADEKEAVLAAKKTLSYFQGPLKEYSCADQRLLRNAIPENRLRTYDSRQLIRNLADIDSVLEIRESFAPGMITAFVRIEGRPLGLIANNPLHLGGAIDADGSDKAARFMQLCDAFDIPVLTLCDTPGFMVGPESEKKGMVRHSSRLFLTGANIEVPMFTIILRKGYGLGAMAMAGGGFHSPVFTVAWPTGEFGAMGIEGEVKIGFQRELASVKDWNEREELFKRYVHEAHERGKAINMASFLEIDDVIDPASSRQWIIAGLNSLPVKRQRNGKRRTMIDSW